MELLKNEGGLRRNFLIVRRVIYCIFRYWVHRYSVELEWVSDMVWRFQ